MAVKLNRAALSRANKLINIGKVVTNDKEVWSEHQPSAQQESEFIRLHGFEEYAKWHLGIDDEENEHSKERYKFPYGNFSNVYRCAVLVAESRAGQQEHHDIASAASQLHGQIEAVSLSRLYG